MFVLSAVMPTINAVKIKPIIYPPVAPPITPRPLEKPENTGTPIAPRRI